MNLELIKKNDNSWWLKHLEQNTVFDTELIKEEINWLVGQAEKLQKVEYEINNSDMSTAIENIIKIINS